MQATCPRCGGSHAAEAEGPAVPCPLCGYTAIVISARPPASREDGEPARWGSALIGCMIVSGLVLVCAMTLVRLAEAAEPDPQVVEAAAGTENCQTPAPVCVDPSIWATATR